MDDLRKTRETWSIILIGIAFLIFTIVIPSIQSSIDDTNSSIDFYLFNQKICQQKHSDFIKTHDKAHFIELLLNNKIIHTEQQIKVAIEIRDRLGFRAQELLADAIMSASVDPTDEDDDTVERHVRLRNSDLEALEKEWEKYVKPAPTDIGAKLFGTIQRKQGWRLLAYCLGSFFFILGTFMQILSNRRGID